MLICRNADVVDGVILDPDACVDLSGLDWLPRLIEWLPRRLAEVEHSIVSGGGIAVFWTTAEIDVCSDILRTFGFTPFEIYAICPGTGVSYDHWLPNSECVVIAKDKLPAPRGEFHRRFAASLMESMWLDGLNSAMVADAIGGDELDVLRWLGTKSVGVRPFPTPSCYASLKKRFGWRDDEFDVLLDPNPLFTRVDANHFRLPSHMTYVIGPEDDNDEVVFDKNGRRRMVRPRRLMRSLVSYVAPIGGVALCEAADYAGGLEVLVWRSR